MRLPHGEWLGWLPVHQTQLVVGEGAPGIIDWDRTHGFAAASVALIHCDAAKVVLENVHRVENRVRPVGINGIREEIYLMVIGSTEQRAAG
jgi:hypothetical protein